MNHNLSNCVQAPSFSPFRYQRVHVQPTSITVMTMLSVITLRDLINARVALGTMEMEHLAPVNYHGQCIFQKRKTTYFNSLIFFLFYFISSFLFLFFFCFCFCCCFFWGGGVGS